MPWKPCVCVCVCVCVSRSLFQRAAVSLAMPLKLWESAGWERGRTFLYLLVLAMGAAVRSLAAPGRSWASVDAAWGPNERITDSPWASVSAAGMSILNSQFSLLSLTSHSSTFTLLASLRTVPGAIVHSWDVHHQSFISNRAALSVFSNKHDHSLQTADKTHGYM